MNWMFLITAKNTALASKLSKFAQATIFVLHYSKTMNFTHGPIRMSLNFTIHQCSCNLKLNLLAVVAIL